MTDVKTLRRSSREKGAEWYQIYLAERLMEQVGGDKILYNFLLEVFMKNEAGHLRIVLDDLSVKNTSSLWNTYPALVQGDNSPLVLAKEGKYIYTRRRKEQEDRFINLLDKLLRENQKPLLSHFDLFLNTLVQSEEVYSEEVLGLLKNINSQRFFIITGGPGTGKTTIVGELMKLLSKRESDSTHDDLKISLAAPTGRAAKRVEQSLGSFYEGEPAQTLHKMLGIDFRTGEPRYNKNNPLPANLVIIDEASMIDLRMMTLLFDSLSSECHLLLVGDRDQLPSVEAGALLSDFLFCIEETRHRLNKHVLILEKVYRSNQVIINLARSVIQGRKEDVFSALEIGSREVSYVNIPARAELFYRKTTRMYLKDRPEINLFSCRSVDWESVLKQIELWFEYYNRLIILSPARKGLYGTEKINSELKKRLNPLTLHGTPIIMMRNDYDLQLFNGDRGVIFSFRGEYHAFFSEPYRHYPLAYLSEWEFSWAQTIHKSQGSEFNQVCLVIPEGVERLLSREILYTGLTRTKDSLEIYSTKGMIELCIDNFVQRDSRIREVLLSDPLPV